MWCCGRPHVQNIYDSGSISASVTASVVLFFWRPVAFRSSHRSILTSTVVSLLSTWSCTRSKVATSFCGNQHLKMFFFWFCSIWFLMSWCHHLSFQVTRRTNATYSPGKPTTFGVASGARWSAQTRCCFLMEIHAWSLRVRVKHENALRMSLWSLLDVPLICWSDSLALFNNIYANSHSALCQEDGNISVICQKHLHLFPFLGSTFFSAGLRNSALARIETTSDLVYQVVKVFWL